MAIVAGLGLALGRRRAGEWFCFFSPPGKPEPEPQR